MTFFAQIYAVVSVIPYGTVASYGQIARMLGRPRAAREVGWAMSNCPEELPWQRVVKADGSITGGVHAQIRRARLIEEGVTFLPDGRVDMETHRWNGESIEDLLYEFNETYV
ncbi:methylated-DNA--protein-cysteine methyltransferase [Clostridia bacterium]|nr:methylated-DNA--protein-cysteine methyltransferase [Clostridia bacterium]